MVDDAIQIVGTRSCRGLQSVQRQLAAWGVLGMQRMLNHIFPNLLAFAEFFISEACGGPNRLSVYSSGPITVIPVPTPQTTNLPGSWVYKGCLR